MPLAIDPRRGRRAARLLYTSSATTGIHGRTEMPEDILPAGIERGSLAHSLFSSLTASIHYQCDAKAKRFKAQLRRAPAGLPAICSAARCCRPGRAFWTLPGR